MEIKIAGSAGGKIVEVAAALTSWRVRYQTMAMQQFRAACPPDFQ